MSSRDGVMPRISAFRPVSSAASSSSSKFIDKSIEPQSHTQKDHETRSPQQSALEDATTDFATRKVNKILNLSYEPFLK